MIVALALHALLLAALWQTWHAARDAPAPWKPMAVRILRDVHAPEVMPPPSPPPTQRAPVSLPAKRISKPDARRIVPPPAPDLASTAAAEPAEPPAATATDAASADKLPAIDPDSITRAARAVARGTTLARESDRRIDKQELPTAQERLAAGVARAARKDCLKGSMDGNGGYEPRLGGLFEIPFLAYDAVTGKCRR